jgi:hypothetical protein
LGLFRRNEPSKEELEQVQKDIAEVIQRDLHLPPGAKIVGHVESTALTSKARWFCGADVDTAGDNAGFLMVNASGADQGVQAACHRACAEKVRGTLTPP